MKKQEAAGGTATNTPSRFSPSEFMRARHPDLFSDSETIQTPFPLPKAVFDHYLESLTSRKQEYEFEHFARKLAEKELCPNLIPQTGPTGGGDGKVDTETYPVSEQIADVWYQGAVEASKERWAFAVSAKKQWKEKVKADVEKIVGTNRGYELIYFISSQYIKASTRSQIEDELKAEHSIPVRILDRTWIIECVYEHDRLQIALETLNITGFGSQPGRIKGAQDTVREQEFHDLEKQIQNTARYEGLQYQLAEDCLRSALLARGLARPRTEIEGLFARAERIAGKVGDPRQKLRIAYQKAWTAYWWFEDLEEFNSLYDDVEKLITDDSSIGDVEKLSTLHTVLAGNIGDEEIDPAAAKLDARTEFLKSKLEPIAADKIRRPSDALWARTLIAFKKLYDTFSDSEPLESVLKDIKTILSEVSGLVAYPAESAIELVLAAGEMLSDNEAYDDLFEAVIALKQERASRSEVGRTLLRRGYQKLRGGKNYDAIKMLGRAQQFLAIRENHREFASALFGCGLAYESVGLLWAARANTLAAADQAMAELAETGRAKTSTIGFLKRLVWLELQLGRVPCVLEWIRATDSVTGYTLSEQKQFQSYFEERNVQDVVLATLFLKTDFWELKWLDFFPQVLDGMKLYDSRAALLYALGYEDRLREDGHIPEDGDMEIAKNFFLSLSNEPASLDLPPRPEFLNKRNLTFRSNVMGCRVSVKLPNEQSSIYLAETILGALEALFATCADHRMFAHRAELKINIKTSPFKKLDYKFERAAGEEELFISHSPELFAAHANNADISEWLAELIIHAGARIFIIERPEEFAKKIFGDEMGMGRALSFSQVAIPLENMLGDTPRIKLADWKTGDITEKFPLKRSAAWDAGLRPQENNGGKKLSELEAAAGTEPGEEFDINKFKHSHYRTSSLIDFSLWSKAGWVGIVYMYADNANVPPVVGFGFRNIEAGRAIFKKWRSLLGERDADEQLRISIITGIDQTKPASYKVMVRSNPRIDPKDKSHRFMNIVSRFQRMDPPDTKNLDMFLKTFERFGSYWLMPMRYSGEGDTDAPPNFDVMIEKAELVVKPAWRISEHSPEIAVISEDDEIIIPEGLDAAEMPKKLRKYRN